MLGGDTSHTAAPGIFCRALSFTTFRLSLRTPERGPFGDESASQPLCWGRRWVVGAVKKVAGQPPGTMVAIARRRDAANRR